MEAVKKKIEKLRVELEETKEKLDESERAQKAAIEKADRVYYIPQ